MARFSWSHIFLASLTKKFIGKNFDCSRNLINVKFKAIEKKLLSYRKRGSYFCIRIIITLTHTRKTASF